MRSTPAGLRARRGRHACVDTLDCFVERRPVDHRSVGMQHWIVPIGRGTDDAREDRVRADFSNEAA
jgi:hypothetical protein